MVDLKALREASAELGERDYLVPYDLEVEHGYSAWREVVESVRALLDAPVVWRCEVHKCDGSEPIDDYAICWYAANTLALNQRAQVERCSMVRVALVRIGDGDG